MAYSRGECRLKQLRKRANLKQIDIARKSGYSRQMIWAFENGQKRMSPEAMYTISQVLGCSMEDLYRWIWVSVAE